MHLWENRRQRTATCSQEEGRRGGDRRAWVNSWFVWRGREAGQGSTGLMTRSSSHLWGLMSSAQCQRDNIGSGMANVNVWNRLSSGIQLKHRFFFLVPICLLILFGETLFSLFPLVHCLWFPVLIRVYLRVDIKLLHQKSLVFHISLCISQSLRFLILKLFIVGTSLVLCPLYSLQ